MRSGEPRILCSYSNHSKFAQRGARRRGDRDATAAYLKSERLQYVGLAFEQYVATYYSAICYTVLNIDRHIRRFNGDESATARLVFENQTPRRESIAGHSRPACASSSNASACNLPLAI